jgi:N-acetylglucosamine-6-phosphate deacetylase
MENLRLHGGNLIIGDEIKKADLLIKNGKIEAIVSAEISTPDYKMHDCAGMNISAGFVEIHSHGGGGSDYMDAEEDTYKNILGLHVQHGTTSVMPTTLSASCEGLCKALDSYLQAESDKNLPVNLLGVHMEGIYISPNQAGAQPPENIRAFNEKEYKLLYDRSQGKIKRWSVAPELDGAKEFADFANKNGITLSIAHSDADFDTVVKAFDWGYRHATHLYSGMSTVFRREGFRIAGVVEAAYYLDGMNVELIADGCHLPNSLLKLAIKTKGTDRVALITDSMRAAGQTSGESFLGSKDEPMPVVIEKGVAMLLTHDAFGGSIATSDRLIRTILGAGFSLNEAVKMATVTPLKMMNLDVKKGVLKEGYDADICVFDDDINIKNVFVNGIKRV